jgi:DNA (cytosine-5)-methyltransferase 1
MDILKVFSGNLVKYRKQINLSQAKFAEKVGLHRTYISAVECGKRSIALENIQKISEALQIEPYKLFIDETNPIEYAAIDLFCGIGGLTHGLKMAGINVVAGVDINHACKYAYEKNNDAIFINKSILDISSDELLNLYPKNAIKILVGCAPCQPFSKYTQRYRKDGHKDDKWKLLYYFGELIEKVLPEIVSMENVPELIHEEVFNDFTSKLKKIGYYVSSSIAYCPDYGVPQSRKRLVLLASRLSDIKLIEPLYKKENYRTVRDVIGGLPPIADGECNDKDIMHQASKLSQINKERIKQSVEGGSWRDWDEKLQLSCHKKTTGKSYPSVYGRMCWDAPSPTITTQFYGYGNGRFGHPEQNRALSLREGALLQSFPLNYEFIEDGKQFNKKELGIHIGNAVPVQLGRAIGISIKEHFQGGNKDE